MAKPWSDVAASPAYQGLASAEQEAVKRQYFDEVVAPQVPAAEQGSAWQQFAADKPAVLPDDSLMDSEHGQPQSGVGLIEGLSREATQGATFEFGDEIGLGGAALAAKAAEKLGGAPDTGRSVAEIYNDMRQHYDAERKQFDDEHPVAATAANIAGGLATGGAGGAKLIGKAAGIPARIATTAAVGGAEGGLYGAGAAEPGGRLEGAAKGAAIGAVVAPVASEVVGGATKALGRRNAEKAVSELAPTKDGLRAAAHAAYDKADRLGVVLKSGKVRLIRGALLAQAKNEGFNPRIHPKVSAALDSFDDLATDTSTLARMEQQRRILRAAANSADPDERRLGSELIDRYDTIVDNLKPHDVTAGDADQAGQVLGEARGLWRRQAKLGLIDDAIERAQNQASGFENGLRTQFRSILNSAKKRRGFTTEEMNQMRDIVRGGPAENTLKFLGRFGFGEKGATNVVGAAIGSSAGYTAGGPVGAVVVPVLGQMARKGAQRATRRNVEELQRLVAAGAHPRYIVNRYATLAGPHATPQELSQHLVSTPHADLLDLAAKLNTLKGPQRKLAADAISLSLAGKSGGQPALSPP